MHHDRQYGARSHRFLEEVGKHAGGKARRAVLNNDGLASLHYWILPVEIVIEMFGINLDSISLAVSDGRLGQ